MAGRTWTDAELTQWVCEELSRGGGSVDQREVARFVALWLSDLRVDPSAIDADTANAVMGSALVADLS